MTDVTPKPTAELPLAEKARLLAGRNFWETEASESAGVRSLRLADGPHGLRHQSGGHDHLAMFDSDPATCFPPGVAIGSSWNPALAAELGAAIGREAAASGVDLVLGPGINIKRTPLCGRNFEYYSEDPLVSGVLGAAYVRALQAAGPGASVKHFAANNQETNRQTVSADVDERTLREIYLPAFERVVREAKPATVMSSYNRINGVYAWASRWLLTAVLRDDWGFDGVVLSDWSSVNDRVAALRAGLDLEMPSREAQTDELVTAVAEGVLDEAELDRSIERLRTLASRIERREATVDLDAHHDLARRIAAECVVLLRNEGDVLPLAPERSVAVIGALAETPRFQGGGSAKVAPTRIDIPVDELRALAEEDGGRVEFAPGYRLDGEPDAALLDEAVVVAREAEVAIVFAGLPEERESEGFDRADLDLPADQVALIRAVAAAAPRTVVVLSNGGVVSLEGWHDAVDAILEGFVLGQGGGRAIAEIVYGRVNPSGHLAESIPLRIEDHPSWLNFPGEHGHVRYGEGVLVGYRFFATAGTPVRYPFGHGLSYTTFEGEIAGVDVTGPDSVRVRVTATNTGTVAGKHLVQLYVGTDAGPVRRPVRELRAFEKVHLEPGESTELAFALDRRSFAYWDVEARDWVVANGEYRLEVGPDAHTITSTAVIELDGDRLATELTLDSTMAAWLDHPIVGGRTADLIGFSAVQVPEEQMAMVRSMTMTQFVRISGLDIPAAALEELMAPTRRGSRPNDEKE
ncbi:MAG: beta-glucosidase [Microbacteriaceae bacterium]|nr:MAG: beta-glucosidase [Microbacteriaceae bacterium]